MAAPLSDIELLSRLVAFDSTSRNSNLPIADFICDYLDDTSVQTFKVPSPDGEKVNLVLYAGPASREGRGLVLSGHLDVVPADEPDWTSDPFRLRVTDDALYGRGACDMKGFVALAVNVLREASAGGSGAGLDAPLVLILTYDEELGTLGAQQFARQWQSPVPLPVAAIIGEPTGLRAVRMHKGHMKFNIGVSGRPAHSGYPHLGDHAIFRAGRVLAALDDLNTALAKETHETSRYYPDTPHCSINPALIEGGTAVNVIPDACRIRVGVRLLPGVAPDDMYDRIRHAVLQVDDANEPRGSGRIRLEAPSTSPPLLVEETSEVYRTVSSLIGQSETVAVSYSSDGGVLAGMGLDPILFGPGDITVAHRPDEYIPRRALVDARDRLKRLFELMCRNGVSD